MIMGGSKEQNLGQFRKKYRDAVCHVGWTETLSPWSNSGEVLIKELKPTIDRDSYRRKYPKKSWDDYLER